MNIIEFTNALGPLRTRVEKDLGVLYNLEDVARGLGYVRKNNYDKPFIRKERVSNILGSLGIAAVSTTDTFSVSRESNFAECWLTEADFWELACISHTTIACQFRRWICEEVLPELARHRVYIMDEATQEQVTDAMRFGIGQVGATFTKCTLGEFPELFRQFLDYHARTRYAKRLELLEAIIKVVRSRGPAWYDALITLRNTRADWQIVDDRNRRRLRSRVANRHRRELTEVTTAANDTIAKLQQEIVELRNVVQLLREQRRPPNITTTGVVLPIHGFTHNCQYDCRINVEDRSKQATYLSPELYQQIIQLPMTSAVPMLNRHVEWWRSDAYAKWIDTTWEGVKRLLPPSLTDWGITNPDDGIALYAGFVHLEKQDIQNYLKSLIDRVAAYYGFNDKLIRLVTAEHCGTCANYQGGRILLNIGPYGGRNHEHTGNV